MKISCPIQLLLLGLIICPSLVRAAEQHKGVILKITDSGKGGTVVPKPLGENPKRIVDELNAQGVTELRLQVNNGEPMSAVTEAGAAATNALAEFGFSGKVIIDNKQWHLSKPQSRQDWVEAMHGPSRKGCARKGHRRRIFVWRDDCG